jgi:carotenoid 1,2-hydratase
VRFDPHIPPGGYGWWYLDALSADGSQGLTIIAFIGSVFSPYYRWAHRRSLGTAAGSMVQPLNHCALNVALYARPGSGHPSGWTMTERGQADVVLSPERFTVGASHLHWDGQLLTLQIDERTAPWGRRVQGVVRLRPAMLLDTSYPLDAAGRHRWCPVSPHASVEVDLQQPGTRWSGTGYWDSNFGDRPLAEDFARWDWSRTELAAGRSAVLYDAERTDGSRLALALAYEADGRVSSFEAPELQELPRSAWLLQRQTRSEVAAGPGAAGAQVVQSLEDGPFYSRAVLRTRLLGEDATAVHESLDMRRWVRPVVQAMLPFRMPRWAG